MATYLTRPVWDFEIDWDKPTFSPAYDAKPLRYGFGAPLYAPTQYQIARGWSGKLQLHSAAKIAAYEAFSDGLKGRFKGFWFPEPRVAMTVLGSAAPGEFTVRECGLSTQWSAGSPYLLWIVDPSGAVPAQGATILGVSAAGDEETVTISAAISPQPGWIIRRLLYARKGSDSERWRCVAEHREEREIAIVERPQEYAALETGEEPVYLYRFESDIVGEAGTVSRYTSLVSSYTVDGETYAPLPINHRAIVRSDEAQEERLTIETVLKESTPWYAYVRGEPERPLRVQVLKVQYGATTGAEVLFTGECQASPIDGQKVSLEFASWLDGAVRVPTMLYSSVCPNELYEPTTCGVDPAAHELAVTVVSTSDLTITVSGAGLIAQPAGYFAHGRLVLGTGVNQEVRGINGDTGVTAGAVLLNISMPTQTSVIGTTGILRPGCNRRGVTCLGKFGNKPRFGGFENLPIKNAVVTPAGVQGGPGKGK
jgi:uncharacterized phage protein (TIGR02218 family)